MKNLKKLFPALLFISLFSGCQRDDLCPESTEVTPLLVIEFYDDEDRTQLRAVQNFIVQATGEEDTLFGPVNTNRIEIPLRTDQSSTEYLFTTNSGTETENTDTITFRYNPSPQYLNRACGFIVNYLGLVAEIQEDEDNWILYDIVREINIEVENETEEAHIYLTH